MARTKQEWIGRTDDAMPSANVRLRIWERFEGVCQCGCGRKIQAGETWDLDHIKPLEDGGENRESNLHPLITAHHRTKTARENTQRARIRGQKKAHIGIRKPSRMPGSRSSKYKIKMDGTVINRETGEPVR